MGVTDGSCELAKGPAKHKEIRSWNKDVSSSFSEKRKL